MPSLLEPPSSEQLRLLRVVAEGWATNNERWPVWQYVSLRLGRLGLDADEILKSFPTWAYGYRSVFTSAGIPVADDTVELTVHGMIHEGSDEMRALVDLFLHMVRNALEIQADIRVDPGTAVQEVRRVADLVHHHLPPFRPPDAALLATMLHREPATWAGLSGTDDSATWDLARPRLRALRRVEDGEGYLSVLDQMFTAEAQPTVARAVAPLELIDALDHLDLAWQLAEKSHLLSLPRAYTVASLTQPVISREEFQARCTALSDVISGWQVPASVNEPKPCGSLRRLEEWIKSHGNSDSEAALEAVSTLRKIVGLRNSQQHSGSAPRADKARARLGLTRFATDWNGEWAKVQVAAIDSFRDIRNFVASKNEERPACEDRRQNLD